MTNIYRELKAGAEILELIDRRRVETDNPTLGSAIERVIIDRCLSELERDAGNPRVVCDAADVAAVRLTPVVALPKLRKQR